MGLPFAYACKKRVCERGGTPGPQAPAQRLASIGNATLLRLRASAGGSPPSTLHPARPAHPSSLVQSLLQCGSLAALVPDPCVARSLVSNLPGPSKPPHHQLRPPFLSHPAAPLDCMPDPRAYTSTDNDWRRIKARRWPRLCAHEHINERASETEAHTSG